MGTKVADSGGGDFTPCPKGVHRAICIAYIDLGTQEGQDFNDPTKTVLKPQVVLMWETPDETIEIDGEHKPFNICKFYTKSIGEKANLGKDLESWRGQEFTQEERDGFDLDNILGVPCQINVVHESKKGKPRAKITAVLPLSKGMEKPTPSITPWRYDVEENGETFPEQLSDGFKKIILKSKEFVSPAGSVDEPPVEDLRDFSNGDPDDSGSDDLPF